MSATNASRLPPTCRFTSVIRAVHGSVQQREHQRPACDSTSREETDLSRFSQAYLNGIALRLNQRPRKTLAFETPANRLQLGVALTD